MPNSDAREMLGGLLLRHRRVAITGGPNTGKTTLAESVTDRPIIHTDDFMRFQWAEQPLRVIEAAMDEKRALIEGVQVPRALRKGLEVGAVLMLTQPVAPQSPRQASMARSIETVMQDVLSTSPSFELIIL